VERIYFCSMSEQTVLLRALGNIGYADAWDLQEQLLAGNVQVKTDWHRQPPGQRIPANAPSTQHHLLLCEHPLVYTLGKSGKMQHVLLDEQSMAARGISFFHTNRGGDITFHGPGQWVGYPILDLERFRPDISWYLRSLEEVIIRMLAGYGLNGDRSPGETGVWLEPEIPARARKICAMGVRCSRWVTMHGFAFNVNTDLSYFGHIIPCGIHDKQVTSLAQELGHPVPMEEVSQQLCRQFERVFDCQLISSEALE